MWPFCDLNYGEGGTRTTSLSRCQCTASMEDNLVEKSPPWAAHLSSCLASNFSESRLTSEAALPEQQIGLRGGRQVTQVAWAENMGLLLTRSAPSQEHCPCWLLCYTPLTVPTHSDILFRNSAASAASLAKFLPQQNLDWILAERPDRW